MKEDYKELEKLVERRLLSVNAVSGGVVAGIVAGLGLFVATNWLLLKGDRDPGPHLSLLGQYFLGYRVTFLGSLVGFVWAFVTAFVVFYAGARLYNRVAAWRGRARPATE